MEKPAQAKSPLQAAYKLLSVRQRSVRELETKLRDKGFGADEVRGVLDFLLDAGLLDDRKFASTLAESRARTKAWGPVKIANDLSNKGISKEIIGQVLKDGPPEETAAAAAFERWKKRNRGLQGREMREKAFRHLKARGFSSAVIFKTIGRGEGVEEE